MRDYDKELADSLDKSDQIAKLESKVEELQRQLAERDEAIKTAKVEVMGDLLRYMADKIRDAV